MKNKKKYILFLVIILEFTFICLNTNDVKADNQKIEEISINEGLTIIEPLEEQKITKLRNILTMSTKVLASPTEEDINKWYYKQLTNDIARDTYNGLINNTSDELVINVTKYKIYTSKSNLSNDFDNNIKPYIYDGIVAYLMDSCENYLWAFGVNWSYSYGIVENGQYMFTSIILQADYDNDAETAWQNRNNFNTKLNEACNSITGNTVYDKVKSINKYICDNSDYAYKADGKTPDEGGTNKLAYGALMNKKAICEGQVRLFNLMCKKKGILSVMVFGHSPTVGHAWNYVYDPTREQWFAVDVTWNNSENLATPRYLMVGSNTVIDGKKFIDVHIPGAKIISTQSYTPATPTLSTAEYNPNAPGITKTYSTTNPTNGNVTVTLKADKVVQAISGWTLSSDKKTLTKSYTTNTEEKVTVKAQSGDATTIEVSIKNIDKTAPTLTVSYSTTSITNQNVIATITSNKVIQEVAGWTLSSDKKQLTKTFDKNVEENVTVKDSVGNSSTTTIKINNIDKTAPTLQIKTDLLEEQASCLVTITSNEEIQPVTNWTLSTDKKKLTRTYTQNTEEEVKIKDLMGNEAVCNVIVSGIKNIIESEIYEIQEISIRNIQPNMTITEFAQNISSNQEYTIKEGDNTVSGEDIIKTGQILLLGGKTYTLIVTGDTNGDGQANIQDILSVNKHRLNKVQLTNEYYQAGDVNNDGKVDLKDILQINKYRLGKVSNL